MMPRVLVIAPIYPVCTNPQAGIFVHRQVVRLAGQGVACRVLIPRPAAPRFPRWLVRRSWYRHYWKRLTWPALLDGVPVHEVPYRRSWTKDEDVIPAMGESIVDWVKAHPEARETDVVYAHFLWTGGAAALALRREFGWPVAAIARGSELHRWHAVNPHCRPHVECVLRDADCLLANCAYLRGAADALVPGVADRMDVVYNGCDHRRFRPATDRDAARRSARLGPADRLLVCCGTVEANKGIRELAEAWPAFAAAHSQWRLAVVGKVVDTALGRQLERAGPGRVRLVGQLPPAGVLAQLQAADAFVQPSLLEGLANATMEAMAVALPVITTATCGQPELIRDGENGWLVPPGDATALGKAMVAMAADPGRAAQFGKAARQTIVERFDADREAAKLAAVLARAARGAAPRDREGEGEGRRASVGVGGRP